MGTASENAHRKVCLKKQEVTLFHPALCLKCSNWPALTIRPGKHTRLLQDICRGNLIYLSNLGLLRSRSFLWVPASIFLSTLLDLTAMKKLQYLHNPTEVLECFRRIIGDLQMLTSKIRNLDTGRVGIMLGVLAQRNVSRSFSGGAEKKHGLGTTGYEEAMGRTCFFSSQFWLLPRLFCSL